MAAHNNTDINLTQDIRTAPNHELVDIVHTSPTGSLPRVPEPAHAALEVDREALEGLQLDLNGPYTGPKSPEEEKQWWPYDFASQKAVYRDDAGLIHHEECTQQKERRIWGFKRRTFIILVAMLGIILLCVAVGGGVSGYYANKSKDTPQPTPTPTLPEDEEPTQPGEPVTSGTTGMAARPCGPATVNGPPNTPQATPHVDNPFITRGGTFEITCRRGIPDVDANIVGAVGRFTEYTFAACMNRCADMIECRGAIYGANLTDMVADGLPGGNCLLKNTTWGPTKPIELWMASAIKV